MIHRRFSTLPPFGRPRAARDVWDASSDGIAAAGWADTFRVEHADLVGGPPKIRPDRQRWSVATCILGLFVMAAVLHGDLRRVASGSNRNGDVEQRRTAIAEAVSRELVRTREAFEVYRLQAARDISSVRDALAVRETSLRQAEQARRVADDLAADRIHAVETMASDLASVRREAEQARAETAQSHVAAHSAAQAAQAAVRTAAAAIEAAPPHAVTGSDRSLQGSERIGAGEGVD